MNLMVESQGLSEAEAGRPDKGHKSQPEGGRPGSLPGRGSVMKDSNLDLKERRGQAHGGAGAGWGLQIKN